MWRRVGAFVAVTALLTAASLLTLRPAQTDVGPRYLSPFLLALSPDKTTVYVSDYTADQVVALDATSGKRTGSCRIDAPTGLAVSPDGKTLYVASGDRDQVTEVALPTKAEAAKINSVADLIRYAKAHPGKLNMASSGNGTSIHLSGELFKAMTGVQMTHVPYKGIAPGLNDVVGGHLPLTWVTYGPVEPYLKDGRIRLLAVAQDQRSPLAPNVPTLAELGVKGVEVVAWNGLFGPKGLPAEVVGRLNTELNALIKDPDLAQRLRVLGMLPVGGSPEVLRKVALTDLDRFTRIVNELGIKAE